MKKQTTAKIILGLIIFLSVVSVSQFSSPTQTYAASMSGLYDNPNQGTTKNPYKFKVSDVVNSDLLMSVVGCTGVVNKVSTWMVNFVQSPTKTAALEAERIKKVIDQVRSACMSTKAGAQGASGTAPYVNDLVTAVSTAFEKIQIKNGNNEKTNVCTETVNSQDSALLKEAAAQGARDMEQQTKSQCLDGIAITLAKNQLSAMTRSMMNWVNSGYGGNPLFVQNMVSLTNKIERNVLETGIDILLAPGNENPYARDFARSSISGLGITSSSARFLGSLQSDLGNFISDPDSYYSGAQLSDAERTETALQRARDAHNAFANDFAVGGWNAWHAMTQRDANNPFGYSILASQYIADTQSVRTQEIQNEVSRNNGFLNQQICVRWQEYNEDGTPVMVGGGLSSTGLAQPYLPKYRNTKPITCYKDGGDCCTEWQTITPGSLIKDKTTAYLNSPERQLELAKTINDSLNALFSVLISKLQGGGLAGLTDSSMTESMNWTDSLNDMSDITSSDGNSTYNNNGAYSGFNLTRDLGNTYYHVTPVSMGNWNANTNSPSLSQEPKITDQATGDLISLPPYSYYTVTTPGTTKLVVGGYNNWANGDRAFWDGSVWQNWKAGEENPIKKRGVIQTQKDYVFAAKEILKVIPNIMPRIGELDYCLPGPNPSYKSNSSSVQGAYSDWLGTMFVGMTDSSGDRWGVEIEQGGDRTFEAFHDFFLDNPNVWHQILSPSSGSSVTYLLWSFDNICNDARNQDCIGNYFWVRNGNLSSEDSDHLEQKKRLQEDNIDYAANKLYTNFYEVFDKMMDKLYFKNVVNEFIPNERSSTETPNPDYIPMSQEGYDITKNITTYAEDTAKATKDYNDSITQAMININKLNPILNEVSGIIAAAQSRRAERMITILNAEATRNGTPLMTEAAYNEKYATCLDEESLELYDVNVKIDTTEAGNCTNGLDDDFDTLVDDLDPDCNQLQTPTASPTGNTNTSNITYYWPLTTCPLNGSERTYQTSRSVSLSNPTNMLYAGDTVEGAGSYYTVGGASTTSPYDGLQTIQVSNVTNGGTQAKGCPAGATGTGTGTTGGGTTTPAVVSYIATFTVYGTGGTVSPAMQTVTTQGGYTSFTVTPDIAGTVPTFGSSCGAVTSVGAGGQYRVGPIYSNCTVNVSF